MMTTRMRALAAACGLLFSAAAFAHGKDGVHLKGTVKAFEHASLTVTAIDDQKESVVQIDGSTKFDRAGTKTHRHDLTVGERVVVHAKKMKDGSLRGQLVKLGKKSAVPDPKADAPEPKKAGAPDHAKD